MANLLYLVHRMPYPPNKGDKVRSYHLLRHLLDQGHEVHLGTFIDDPDDAQHIDTLRSMCASLHVATLDSRTAKLGSLIGLLSGQALTLRYYHDAGLHRWVASTIAAHRIDATVVFSSSMVQYAQRWPLLPMLVDLVDVDSAKWRDYADAHHWPLSWLYRREGRQLLAYEQAVVARAAQAFLVTPKEVALFEQLAPGATGRVRALGNGVDAEYFHPDPLCPSPFAADELPVVFTGAMDYWPNVDAVTWFAQTALPMLRQRWPKMKFHVVGRNPTAAVMALISDGVGVSGTVPDVRPYLQHAAVVVAPLRLARGLQNKVLEAMAMARPVVAAGSCVDAIDVRAGEHLLSAETVNDYVQQVGAMLGDAAAATALGLAGRQRVLEVYSWSARLGVLDQPLADACRQRPAASLSTTALEA